MPLNRRCERVRATKHAPSCPFRLRNRRHGLADIVERGAVGVAERDRVIHPHPERDVITISENTPRHEFHFARQCLGLFEAL